MSWCPNKFRLESTRLRNWDYSRNGWYYVTICVKEGRHLFGQIIDGQVQLSEEGTIAAQFWREIPQHFADVVLDRFIVMPNHVHGILGICKDDSRNSGATAAPRAVSTFGPLKPGSLPVVVGSYKAAVTRWCHQNGYLDFAWQPKFHDQVIEDERAMNEIREYIGKNPERWELKKKL